MSPDDVFAAQFWPWPDPAIKRDAHGRVLFVNAAFLALYGGSVDDWRGHSVGGWPAPQGPSADGSIQPFRFETRVPHDAGEQVYDWMEQTLADGNAFALARNVTVFTQAPDPDPGERWTADTQDTSDDFVMPPVADAPAYDAQTAHFGQAEAPATQEYVAQTTVVDHAPAQTLDVEPQLEPAVERAHLAEQPAYEAPAAEAPVAQERLQTPEIPDIEIPDIPIPDLPIPEDTPAAAAPPEREYERRALPIEDESAVLGNNWRDAVIAKAVGATAMTAKPEAPVEEAPVAPPSSDDGTVRILLAEDNAINALLTRTLLEAEGHIVDTVEDGALAVEAMKTAQYDLIFMDMRMPNMDGLEATRKIRTLPNVSQNLPIIALTANAFDDDRNACFDSGMNDFMTKPVSAEELSEMVGQWTGTALEERIAS